MNIEHGAKERFNSMKFEAVMKATNVHAVTPREAIAAYKTIYSISIEKHKKIYKESKTKEEVEEKMSYVGQMIEDTFWERTGLEEEQI